MRRTVLLMALLGCGPRIDAGPVPVVRAARPVEVLARPAPGAEVHFVAVVEAGSAYDPPGAEGLALLTAHAAVLGATERPSGPTADGRAPLLPPDFEVHVDRERVTLTLRCSSARQAECAERFAAVLATPRLEDETVDRAREFVRASARALAERPDTLGREALAALVFEAHPYAHAPTGRTSVHPLLSAAQVRRFHARHWVRASVRVGVVGDVDDATPARLGEALRALPASLPADLPLMAPVPVAGSTLAVVETPAAGEVAALHLGWPLAVGDTGDRLALEVAAAALARPGGEGRLPRALRDAGLPAEVTVELPGLVCTADASFRRQPHAAIHVGPIPPERAGEALGVITTELGRLVDPGLDPSERAAAAEHVRAARAARAEDPARALACSLAALAAGLPDPAELPDPTAIEPPAIDPSRLPDPGLARIVAVGGPRSSLARTLVEDQRSPLVSRGPGPGAALVGGVNESPTLRLDGVWTLPAEDLFR